MTDSRILDFSVQINNGLTDTSGDGVQMAFDKKYGIMFCVYMPGMQGRYGESRSRISLAIFPASQPTNIRWVTVSEGNDEYLPNIVSLGNGRVRVLYEKHSRSKETHYFYFKDYDFLSDSFTEEVIVMLKREDGQVVPFTTAEQMEYLEKNGCFDHAVLNTEEGQLGGHTIFRHEDGLIYGTVSNYRAEPILYRSADNMRTVEFFAIHPRAAQYEFDYKILNGKIYAVYRTFREDGSIAYVTSGDMGKSWSEPIFFEESIQCRPRVIIHNGHILMSYNYYNNDTGNRPKLQQGRTAIRLRLGEDDDPYKNRVVADIHSKHGIVNVCLIDILGEAYMAYSTSILALEAQNGDTNVRGKDAVRYVRLGDLG